MSLSQEWTADREFRVTSQQAIAYAAATNDVNPRCLQGEVVPPVFAAVVAGDVYREAVKSQLPLAFGTLAHVHGEQDIWIRKPMEPETTVYSRASLIGLRAKRTGTVDVVKTETRDETGALVNEQYWTGYLRDVKDLPDTGQTAPEHTLTDDVRSTPPLAKVSQVFDSDQTYRYAEASGDHTAYHIDNEVARSIGFADGIIVHGLCTMAFASWAVVGAAGDNDPTRLERIAVRFSRPLTPGQSTVTNVWALDGSAGPGTYAFETVDRDGEPKIMHGLARFRL